MMKSFTAVVRIWTVGVLMALAGTATAQQAYPNRPIRIITPFPPGGGSTIIARLFGQKLTESWGQQVIVDNRPGANGIIGSQALIKSPPDGYTTFLTGSIHTSSPSLYTLPYDTIKDFAPIATVTSNEFVLVLHPSVPANSVQEFIALAKAKPGQLNYASVGNGSSAHLAAELLCLEAGIKMQHVPYKGVGQILPDLIGGQVQLAFMNPSGAMPNIKSGQLKAIAITGDARVSVLPQVPTFIEGGLPGVLVKSWWGLFAPAGTPKEIIDKLAAELAKIAVMPDIKEKLAAQGAAPYSTNPEQFARLINTEIAKYARIIKAANIKLEK